MYKQLLSASAIGLASILLMAAAVQGDLPQGYWEPPAASAGPAPHDWSAMEAGLAPEDCAQCHAEQFDAWKHSMHAKAFSPGLIGQFPQQDLSDSNDCLNCHAPLAEQKYAVGKQMNDSLMLKLKNPNGFDSSGEVQNHPLPLRHAGVTCASCHVRGWQRYGPPQRGSGRIGKVDGPAHGGFTGSRGFEQSEFCASCHQFPDSYAINGKPLENTLNEWKQSRFAKEGVQCQTCHMPDRRHAFKGIHDPATVRGGLKIESAVQKGSAILRMTSTRIGHAFPTYVTPKVVVSVEALGDHGDVTSQKQWEIERRVAYDDGWKEISDTRLQPGETRNFELKDIPPAARSIRFRIDVIPDNFYKGVYRDLLDDGLEGDAGKLIHIAQAVTERNDYRLYEQEVKLDDNESSNEHGHE